MHDRTVREPRLAVPHTDYFPAIDGLRFFAVGSVLLFHLWHPLLPGGFVGVDVFFVISGYLITGMLARGDHTLTLVQFYQNRIARIGPASLATIVAALVAGYFLYDDQTFAYLGSAALFAATSLINIKLLFQSSYFAASPDAQPLLHFWSLAVEEQFYLFYPALLIVLRRCGLPLRPVIAGMGLLSLALCVALTWTMPTYAFYLLPTRAWELFGGGWLALSARSSGAEFTAQQTQREQRFGWIGLGLLLLSFAFVSEGRPFPGVQAAVPVLAAMLMLMGTRSDGPFARFLSLPGLTWVGLRSYSLYLWHWPVYSFVDYALFREAWLTRLPVKIGLTLAFALVSYHLIEKPLRRRLRTSRARVAAFAGFFAVVAGIGFVGNTVRNSYYLSAEGGALDRGGYAFNPAGKPAVFAFGDSESAMYATVLRDMAKRNGWRLRLMGAAGTNELPGEKNTRWPAVEAWLRKDRPGVVVLVYAWGDKIAKGADLDSALATIGSLGARTVLVLDAPFPAGGKDFNPRSGRPLAAEADPAVRVRTAVLVRAIAARHPGVTVVDPAAIFLAPDGQVRVMEPGHRPDLYDNAHLSREGAEKVAPLIEHAIRDEAGNAAPQ